MLCKNAGAGPARFQIDGDPGQAPTKYDVEPGGVVDIAEGYCKPYESPTGRKMKPIITQLNASMRPMGVRAKGVVTVEPVLADGEQPTMAQLMAKLSKMSDKQDKLAEDNAALRRENTELRASAEKPAKPAKPAKSKADAETSDGQDDKVES
jgi:hypothetical protein